MNAYKNYVLTVGNIEASILAAEGTDEYISTLLQVTDERMVETVRRLRIDATKHVLVNSKDRQEDLENIKYIHQELVELLENSIEKVKRVLH